jgi:hypothetical protein
MGRTRFFFYASACEPSKDGHKRITVGPDFRVEGGDEGEHRAMAELSERFVDNMNRNEPESPVEVARILRQTVIEYQRDHRRARPR